MVLSPSIAGELEIVPESRKSPSKKQGIFSASGKSLDLHRKLG
jgi:hypothetical protein